MGSTEERETKRVLTRQSVASSPCIAPALLSPTTHQSQGFYFFHFWIYFTDCFDPTFEEH